jgi:hypothetical protein
LSDCNTPTPFLVQNGEPTFQEGWQAEVLAIAQALIDKNVITGNDWAHALGKALRDVQQDAATDTIEGYYAAALMALEQVAQDHCGISKGAMNDQRVAWKMAYETTPHGQPVVLKSDR